MLLEFWGVWGLFKSGKSPVLTINLHTIKFIKYLFTSSSMYCITYLLIVTLDLGI